MQTDRLPLHQDRIERLDAEPMECGGTVQKYGVLLDDLIEDVQTSGFSFSTRRLALLMVVAAPRSSSLWKMTV